MNLSGICVSALPDQMDDCRKALEALPGIEVHQIDRRSGRLIVVQEADSVEEEMEGLRSIQKLPEALRAELIYHRVDVG